MITGVASPPVLSALKESSRPTSKPELDRAVEEVAAHATEFARLPIAKKAQMLRECISRITGIADRWVAAACDAKHIDVNSQLAGEEWLAGVVVTVRGFRLVAESLEATAAHGTPPFGRGIRIRDDGRVEINVFPTSRLDAAMYSGYSGWAVLDPGITEEQARERQASFYKRSQPDGAVTLILGAGNVSSIPPADVLTKMFEEGHVCVLKMNPVNEWLGPILEDALSPLIAPGFLRIVYGGAEEGAYLAHHPGIHDIHITGSAATYDAIVWGPPGPERERRKAANDPVTRKPVTAELGNISPFIVVPGDYSERQLWYQARALVSQVANNASFNCNATKMVVLSSGWRQADHFRELIRRAFSELPTRFAYYPGAEDRYEQLVGGHSSVERFGEANEGHLQWAYVRGLDGEAADEPLFNVEPFCGIVSETTLIPSAPDAFLEAAVEFCNERLWGTLSAMVMVDPSLKKDSSFAPSWHQAIDSLRYGTVGVNIWPALAYAMMSPPWGGHPSSTPQDIKSGIGWVHNTYLLEGVEKAVFEGPIAAPLKPAWHYDNRRVGDLARALVVLDAAPSWTKLPRLMGPALRG